MNRDSGYSDAENDYGALEKLFDDVDTSALDEFLSRGNPFETCSFDEQMALWNVEPYDVIEILDGVNTEEELRNMVREMDGGARFQLVLDAFQRKNDRELEELFRGIG